MEKLLNLVVERSASHNHFLEFAAECAYELLADLPVYKVSHAGHHEQSLSGGLVEDRAEFVAVNLFENERNAENKVRFHLGEGFEQEFGGGKFAQQGDMGADSERHEHIESASVGVGQGQEAEHARGRKERHREPR